MRKHIVHHTKRLVRHVRGKPYTARMQIIHFMTVFCGVLVILLWITFLKHQLQVDPVQKKADSTTKSLFTEQVVRVYSDIKGDKKENKNNKNKEKTNNTSEQ